VLVALIIIHDLTALIGGKTRIEVLVLVALSQDQVSQSIRVSLA